MVRAGIDSSNNASLSLPHFLSKLQQKNVLPNDDTSNGLVTEAVKGYKQARYNPGVCVNIYTIGELGGIHVQQLQS